MLSKTAIKTLKKEAGDFNNPIFKRYVLTEKKARYICPVCSHVCQDYKDLYSHMNEHPEHLQTEEVKEALDPLNGIKKIIGPQTDPELVTIGKFFGEQITSVHNQHILINVIGKTGMGKSNAGMRIGEEVARYVANVKGGVPGDFFSIHNIAIMRLDSIVPIMEDLDKKRFNIIVLDDIGASYSARDYSKPINKNINKVFQTFRDTNTLVILTMPDTFLIDKVGRKLAHYQIEITEKRHDEAKSEGKLFEVVEQYRKNSLPFYKFIIYNGVKYPRIVFRRASDDLVQEYESKRKEIRKVMMAESLNSIKNPDGDGDETAQATRTPKHMKLAGDVLKEIQGDPKVSNSKLAKKLETSRETIANAKEYLTETGRL